MAKKLRWFKFFFIYKKAFEELSGRKCKKLILAICDYAENGTIPAKLDSHTMDCFNSIKQFHDADKELSKIYGSKGGKKAQKGGSRVGKPEIKGASRVGKKHSESDIFEK